MIKKIDVFAHGTKVGTLALINENQTVALAETSEGQ